MTLVELMVVVVILSLASTLAVLSTRSSEGDKAPAFARGIISMAHEARHAAFALGQPTRLRLTAAPMAIVSEQQDPANPNGWIALGNTLPAPHNVELCAVAPATKLATFAPTCPLAAATSICIMPTGQVSVTAGATCPGLAPVTGATIFTHTFDDQKRYKLMIFSLTALPRLSDRW